MIDCWNLITPNGRYVLEFIEDGHIYLVDGVKVKSITQILKTRFGGKYKAVDTQTLRAAANMGTATHKAIEDYCKEGIESDIPELRGFKWLQKQYGFNVLNNEVPVILFDNDEPIVAGRLDLVLEIDGRIGGADIKRTSTLDKEYLGFQLNLYRIAYRQTYGIEWEFLKGVHLRETTRKFVDIPINEPMAWELIDQWKGENES